MKDLREAAYILWIKIYRDRSKRLIGLCQSAYIKKNLKRYSIENSKHGSIPMQEKLKLSKSQGAFTPAEMKRMQNVPYALAVGSIMYAVRCTRPDVAFAQNIISRFQQNLEAEYIAAFDASKEAVWVRKFISGLSVVPTVEERISMYCDNTGEIAIANESGITKGARHFRAKVHYLQETDMDGNVHIYKALLVAKGFTQTLGIDYEETFSPVADIRAIRILIAIAAYYDYEIWQMDVKTAFLNGYLNKEVYMEQPEGFVNPKYTNRVLTVMCNIMYKDSLYYKRSPLVLGYASKYPICALVL
nr:retrotransposon protein, putative, Ty1-copia subclass [Tanacetum cinerariifolium]